MSATRPRLLLIKSVIPYPPDQGTRVLSFGLIRALRGSFDVTVLSRVLDDGDRSAAQKLEEYCDRVVTVFPPNKRSILHRAAYKLWYQLVSLFTRRSLKSLYDCPGAFKDAARRLAREEFDLVIIEYWQLYPLLELFPSDRVVLLTHDIDLLVNRKSALLEKRLLPKVRKVRRWMMEQREEVKAYQGVRRILALTERDAQAVVKLSKGHARVDVLPFGLDPGRFEPPAGESRRKEVLFMGALHAAFNIDSLDYFARSIYPLLDETCDFTLTIVGGKLPAYLEYLGRDPRVSVVGRVDDVRPYLHWASCIVIPLRFGGGLRIRTLEAMLAGLPVVCTTVAMAGMDFEPGRDYLLADTAEDFASEVNRLLNSPELVDEIAARALVRATSLYGWEQQDRASRALLESYIKQ